jgi:hypothetical protein
MTSSAGVHVQLVDLENLSGAATPTLLVHLPASAGRARVAFLPLRSRDITEQLHQALRVQALWTLP